MNKKVNILILNAGKIPKEMRNLFGDISSGSIPVNGQPSIVITMNSLFKYRFKNIYISIDSKKSNRIVNLLNHLFYKKMNIRYIESNPNLLPGYSFIQLISKIKNKKPILLILGDTLIHDKLLTEINNYINTDRNFVLTSLNYDNPKDWCLVKKDKNNRIVSLYDKSSNVKYEALIGIYFLKNINLLKKILKNLYDKNMEISKILSEYIKNEDIYAYKTYHWMDIGHIEKYYETKKKLIQSRSFNNLSINDKNNTIMKTSKNKDKILKEINWYLKIPMEIKAFTPQLIDFDITKPSIIMEYIGYPTLSELFLYADPGVFLWKHIINKLINVLQYLNGFKVKIDIKDYLEMYITKTERRLKSIRNTDILRLMKEDYIIINKIKYKNFQKIKKIIYKKVLNLYNKNDNSIIHGDFCFSNILFDKNNGTIKLIDPRGSWGNSTIGGDIKYDIAKLSHSICGYYDFIKADMFHLSKISKKEYEFEIYLEKEHRKISDYFLKKIKDLNYKIEDIRLIEGLLFLSMIPLHNDNKSHQLAFYLNGIKILNDNLNNGD